MNSESVRKYRKYYREKHLPKIYSGRAHFALTLSVTVSIIGFAFYNLENVTAIEWIAIPLVLFLANFVEYIAHKGPMHKKMRYVEEIYRRHAVQHHSFFTQNHMNYDSSQDFGAVLFPPVMLLFFFGGIATPLGLISYWIFGENVGWLFVFSAALYFLNYEIMHFLFHVDEEAWTSKLPFMGSLRQLHTLHHDRKLMNDYNFNITYPVCDILFGTYYRKDKAQEQEKGRKG